MATANIKDVKRRIKSVENTMQITKAMELVATSKLRSAKERAVASQPYFNTLYETMCEIQSDRGFKSIYTKKEFLKTVLVVVLAGDRGLAGGFNHNVLKLAEEKIKSLEKDGRTVKVFPIGKKAVEYLEKRKYEIYSKEYQISDNLTMSRVISLSEKVISGFRNGIYDKVELVYTTFVSTLVQNAMSVTVLPIESDDLKGNEQGSSADIDKAKKSALTLYEPSAEEVFDGLIPKYISGLLFCSIVDSYASEQAARRTAMESASDNASEMIDSLSLLYNRARQAQITQELNEIVAGQMGNN